MLHGKTLYLEEDIPDEQIVEILKAIASLPRWRILHYLADRGHTVQEIASALDLPASTATAHIKILEEAGLVRTELEAASRGLQKVCTRAYDNLAIQLPDQLRTSTYHVEVAMPIGAYTRFEIQPMCGIASQTAVIGYLDDPLSFYEPERIQAGLLWFKQGFIEYSFPNRLPHSAILKSIQVSMEICSEAPLHNHVWPSDITIWINEQELGTWTCPGDFGGTRGHLTPDWWDINDSQYGLLKRWLVTSNGAFIDGHRLSSVGLDQLRLDQQRVINVRIGIKPDAIHIGGLNLFGRSFGNYPQDLGLRLEYVPGQATSQPGQGTPEPTTSP
jgi:predicted transcriptional regulator